MGTRKATPRRSHSQARDTSEVKIKNGQKEKSPIKELFSFVPEAGVSLSALARSKDFSIIVALLAHDRIGKSEQKPRGFVQILTFSKKKKG